MGEARINIPNFRRRRDRTAAVSPSRQNRARFFDFIQPLPLLEPNDVSISNFASISDDDYHLSPCRLQLLQTLLQIAGAALTLALLLSTLTLNSLKQITPMKLHIAGGVTILLPLYKQALALLVVAFGRFICIRIVAAAVFLLSIKNLRLAHVVLYSNESAAGTYVWGAILYHFAADLLKSIPNFGSILTGAFVLFAVGQGERILFQIFRSIVYVRQFDAKMKEVELHLYLLEELASPAADEKEVVARCGCLRRMRRRRRLEYGAGGLSPCVDDRIVLAKIDGFRESEITVDRRPEILAIVNAAFPATADGSER